MKIEFISLAPYLENSSGHLYHFHLSMQKALKELVDFRLLLPRTTQLSPLPENWHLWFSSTKKKKGSFWNYLQLFSKSPKKRIFFLEYYQKRDFFLFSLALFLRASKNDTLWIFCRDDFRIEKKKKRILQLSKLLSSRLSSRFVVLTDTEQLQKLYSELFVKPVHLLPINHAPFYYPQKQKKKIVLSWLGVPRKEKGLEKIKTLLELPDPFAGNFILQFSKQFDNTSPTNGLEIKKLEIVMSPNMYTQALLDSDCVLLPYDPHRYRYSSSGIFVEAIAAGKIPLVHRDTWTAFELQKYDLQELILNWQDPLLYQKIYELTTSSSLRKKLFNMQKSYISFHNPLTFKNCIHKILEKHG